ncbi:MAG: HDOD domain-containing protein [Nitrospirae bacterium]|nr:HDOD domain-containing protein [Nitrospirota bacterium]
MEAQGSKVKYPLLFEGLSEKDVISLYNTGKLIKIRKGDVLIKEGDEDKTLYFIINGVVKVLKNIDGKQQEIATIKRDSWVGEIAFLKESKRTATIVADEDTNLLSLDERAIRSVKPEILLIIFKQLSTIATLRINEIIRLEIMSQKRTKALMLKLKSAVTSYDKSYENNEHILNVLNKIPMLPAYTNTLITMLASEKTAVTDVVELVKSDPSLAAIVLKTVNSAYYNLKNKISDIHHAILFLGFNQLYQIILDSGIKKCMPNRPEFTEILNEANALSILGLEISISAKRGHSALIGTVGLLSKIGKSIQLLLEIQNPKFKLFLSYLNHYQLGAMLLKKWGLPEIIHESVYYLCYPDFATPDEIPAPFRDNIAVLYIAETYYRYLKNNSDEHPQSAFTDMYMNCLSITENSPVEFVNKKILPLLNKKLHIYPETFRQLFVTS